MSKVSKTFLAFTNTAQPKNGSELNFLGIKQRYRQISKRCNDKFFTGGRGFPCKPSDQII